MRKVVGLLAAAVILTGIATIHLSQKLSAERKEADELATREMALKLAPPPLAAVQSSPEPAAPAVAVSPQLVAVPAITAMPTIQQPAAGAANPPVKGMLEALASPEGQDAARAMMRVAMAQLYPDIEQELGITAQEKQRLFDLLADDGGDSASLMMGAKDPAARREMQRRLVESARARDAKVSSLLGSKYPKWEEYQSTTQARQQVDQLRRTLSVSDTPMSEAQSSQLVIVFATELKRANGETREWSTSSAAIDSPDMMRETLQRAVDIPSRLVDVAAPVLTIAQMERYKRLMEQQVTVLRRTMSMMGVGGQP
jgi:hypothetical protein